MVKNQSGKISKKSKKSRIANITELAKLQFLSVKRVLTLLTPCTVIYLVVLIELLLNCIFICMSNCVLIEHLAVCERFKVVKSKIKSVPSSFSGLTFLYLPNVYIHEPNEFIHVRKLKPTLKIQTHYLECICDFLYANCVTRTRLITGSNLVPFIWLELCYNYLV